MKLLVVDDEPAVLQVMKTMLQSLGYDALAVPAGEAAKERIDREKFSGAFVDARMPGVDGIALTRHIRNSTSNGAIPIVMLTGFDDVETMRAAFKAGITFFLAKPVEVARLSALLRVMQEAMLREKRSYVRLPLRTVVTCRVEQYQFRAASLNISEGGMMLDASGGVGANQEVELRFSLPNSPALLNPRATVVRVEHGDRMAVRFLSLDDDERKAIQDYIAGKVKE